MRVRYTVPAARSLERVLDHIAEHSPQDAKRVQARIQSMVALVAQYPYAGQPTGRRGTRRILASPWRLPAILRSLQVVAAAEVSGLTADERDTFGRRRAARGRGHVQCLHRRARIAGLFKAVYRKSDDEAERN